MDAGYVSEDTIDLLAIFDGAGGRFTSNTVTLEGSPNGLPTPVSFSVLESDTRQFGFGSRDFVSTFSDVTSVEILALATRAPSATILRLDNIAAIPEPSSIALLAPAGLAFFRRRR